MSSITWQLAGSGYWSRASNWSGGVVPGAADSVTLTSAATETIYLAASDSIASLTSTNDLLWITGGNLAVSGNTALAGGLHETGGTLTLLGASNSISGGLMLPQGDIILGGGVSLTLTGTGSLGSSANSYGAHIHGAGTLITAGTLTINQNGGTTEATFGGGLVWQNTGRVNDAGIVSPAYTAGNAYSIINQAHAIFNFTTDIACLMDGQAMVNGQPELATSSFNNAGLLEKTGGTGTTTFYCTIQDTGTIKITTGTIEMEGGGVIGGLVTGTGTLDLAVDAFTLSSGLTLAGTLTMDTQVDQTGPITLGTGGTTGLIYVDDLYNLDDNGAVRLGAAGSAIVVNQQGTLADTGTGITTIATGLADDGLILVDAGKLLLAGAVGGTGHIEIANGATLKTGASINSGIIVTLGTGSELQIGDLHDFGAEISNFTAGNTLDLVGLTVTSATAASTGTLTLLDGSATLGSVLLAGNPSGDVFKTLKDGNGGTLLEITSAAAHAPAKMQFVAARPATAPRLPETSAPHHGAISADPGAWLHAETMGHFGGISARVSAPPAAAGVISLSGTFATALSLSPHEAAGTLIKLLG